MKIFMLSGAGGTGKTTLLKNVCGSFPKSKVVGSLTRQAYAEYVLKNPEFSNEGSALSQSFEARQKFQDFVFEHYLDNVYSLIESSKSEGVTHLMFERSPWDHLAYAKTTLVLARPSSTGVEQALSLMDRFEAKVIYFPYPAPWHGDNSTKDGFRHVDKTKDSAWDDEILKLLLENQTSFSFPYYGTQWFQTIPSFNLAHREAWLSKYMKGNT
jgi:predicted ATPase